MSETVMTSTSISSVDEHCVPCVILLDVSGSMSAAIRTKGGSDLTELGKKLREDPQLYEKPSLRSSALPKLKQVRTPRQRGKQSGSVSRTAGGAALSLFCGVQSEEPEIFLSKLSASFGISCGRADTLITGKGGELRECSCF